MFFPVFPVLTPRERGAIDWGVARLWRQEPFVRVLGVEVQVEKGGDRGGDRWRLGWREGGGNVETGGGVSMLGHNMPKMADVCPNRV